jgi:hypothetical protein
LTRKKGKGTRLKVFSGREATLNYVIFLILYSKKLLTSYEMYSEIRSIKGCRHIKRQNVDRRLKALRQQHWLEINGKKPARAHFLQPLYQLSVRAQAALEISKKDLNDLLQTAPEDQLRKLIDALSICP